MSTPMNSDQSPIAAGAASPEGLAPMIESMRCALFGEESPFFPSLRPRVEYSTADNAGLSQTKRRIFPELSPSERNVQESTPAPLPVAATTPPAIILSPQREVSHRGDFHGPLKREVARGRQGEVARGRSRRSLLSRPPNREQQRSPARFARPNRGDLGVFPPGERPRRQPRVASVSFHPGAASAPSQTGATSLFFGRRPRGRPVGSKNKQKSKPQPKPITVDGAQEIVSGSAISRFTPHEFFVKAGEGGNLLGTAVSTNSEEYARSHTKPVITLTGTAEKCAIGPPLGLVDIGESENAYLFRVALPGVRHKCNIKCDIQREGRVRIEGVVAESEVLKKSPKGYEMKVQQLSPPGPFTVSFSLPGPVDPRLCSPHFRADGILEVIVMKYRIPLVSAEGLPENWYNGSFPDP
ncbi:uncharacterized protein LOC132034759 [Lycium ferocissimum]|uniref:uncharacterized protein LOC132034759 n=1 Tax=Lycium ferocissimum TaxID=112874 RepID=UPI0028159EE9|nr:uncharacterized protein LOC132034759 [Lycium ferocissimum]